MLRWSPIQPVSSYLVALYTTSVCMLMERMAFYCIFDESIRKKKPEHGGVTKLFDS